MSGKASLNHVYRTVWNEAIGAMVAVAEVDGSPHKAPGARLRAPAIHHFPAIRLGLLALSIAVAWSGCVTDALANPTGAVAVVGQAALSTQGSQLVVTTQNGAGQNHSLINWQSFSIPAGSSTYFQQPGATSTSINRVVTNTPSQIFGTLGSNGHVVLVNQSGITVGKDALVDTAGFTASSLKMSDADAFTGRMRFGDGSGDDGGVTTLGSVIARRGDVVLLGSNVTTGKDALIQAPNGTTLLAAGQQIELTGRGLEGITLHVQAPNNKAVNLGALQGDAVGVFAGTLKHSGFIQARTAAMEGGKVVLKADGDTYVEGSGVVDASSSTGKGGDIRVLGGRVALTGNARVDASGATGGGRVLVGGDYQGMNPTVRNANFTFIGAEASIAADATRLGDGGRVIAWADDTAQIYGHLSVRGGAMGGNGGFVETSGKLRLDVQRAADIAAPMGTGGTWLLDPSDIDIGTANSQITQIAGPPITFNPTQTDTSASQVSVATLQTALAAGSVIVDASAGSGGGTGNITVSSAITWTTSSNLKLKASNNIAIGAAITGTSGSLSLELGGQATQTAAIAVNALDVTTAGTVTLTNAGNAVNSFSATAAGTMPISYWNSTAMTVGAISTVGGGSVLDIKTLSGALTTNAAINGQDVSLNGFAGLTLGGNVTASQTLSLTAGAGADITQNSGSLSVTSSTTTVNAGRDVMLKGSGSSNQFSSLAITSGRKVGVKASGGLTITSLTRSANNEVELDAGGALTLPVGAINAGSEPITLKSGTSGLSLPGNLTTTGLVTLTTGSGAISSNTYSIAAGGLVATNTSSGTPGAISLGVTNAVSGSVDLTSGYGGAITFANSQAFTVNANAYAASGSGAINITGSGNLTLGSTGLRGASVTVNLTGGSINQSGATGWINTLSNNGNITLTGSAIGSSGTGNMVQIDPGSGLVSLTAASGSIYLEQRSTTPTLDVSRYTVSAAGAGKDVWLAGTNIAATLVNFDATTVDDRIGLFATGNGGSVIFPAGGSADSAASFKVEANTVQFASSGVTALNGAVVVKGNTLNGGSGQLTLSGAMSSNATGDSAIFVQTGGNFVASGMSSAPNVPNGRWLIYANDPSTTTLGPFALTSTGFQQYSATYGTTSPGQATGNGVLYASPLSISPVMTGSVTKVFDGTAAISLSGAVFSCSTCNDPPGLTVGGATFSGGSGTLDTEVGNVNVGTGKLVYASGLTVSGVVTTNGAAVYGISASSSANIGSVTPARAIASIGLSGSRPYDGTNIVNAGIFSISGLLFGETLTLTGAGTVADKNVGDNKPVSLGTLALGNGTGLASNYTLTSATASITPLKITGITGLTVDPRVYDGGIKAILSDKSVPTFAGMVSNDKLTLSVDAGTFTGSDGRHVGVDKPVEFTGIKLGGADAINYLLDPALTTLAAKGTITQLDSVSWIGGDGAWSAASNWAGGAIPDRQNVRNVIIPSGSVVTYDGGDTVLSSLSSGRLIIAGGSLTAPNLGVSGSLELGGGTLKTSSVINTQAFLQTSGVFDATAGISTPNFKQTGGTLNTPSLGNVTAFEQSGGVLKVGGALSVDGSFSQTAGSIETAAAASITQRSGNLSIGALKAVSVSLSAPSGAVTQSGPLNTGSVSVNSASGALLTNSGNRISSFTANSTGTGSVELVNTGVLDVQGITIPGGNIVINNTGGVTVSKKAVTGNGSITGVANSPLTIGPEGISATSDIVLRATNLTSAGNMTLIGDVNSSAGSVTLDVAQDLTQNGLVFGATGASATVGGTATFGPDAQTKGFPVRYFAGGVQVIPPGAGVVPGVTSGAGGNAPNDFVLTFLTKFDQALEQQVASSDTPGEKKKDDNGIVVEGQTCTR